MWFLSTSINIDQELTFSYSAEKAESQTRPAGWVGRAGAGRMGDLERGNKKKQTLT